jgi:hypothetical protein
MQKPNDYDLSEAKRGGNFNRPQAGAYVMKILNCKETMSKTERTMLVLQLDIATGEHKDNYKKFFDFMKSKNSEAKWPLLHRRCTDGNQTPYFKGDIKAIEESNEGFHFNFDESTLKGKLVGAMLAEKEIDASGKTILEIAYLCSVKKATSGELKPPKVKQFVGNTSGDGESYSGPDYGGEPLPF